MRNSILLTILALFFSLHITGCSLFSSDQDESETATVAEEGMPAGAGDFSEDEFASDDFESMGEKKDTVAEQATDSFESGGDEFGEDLDFNPTEMAQDESGSLNDLASADFEVEDNFGDEYSDDDYAQLGEGSKDNFSEDFLDDGNFGAADTNVTEAQPVDDSLFVDEGGLPTDTMSANQDTDLFGQEQDMEPVIDTPTYADSSFSESGMDSFGSGEEVEKNYIPVKKMKPAAYQRAGANVNRLYVVRPGDNMESVAQKIYGNANKLENLYSINPHFRGKTVKVGDKVYYESPNNPNDPAMLTYYEDSGVSPQYYTSEEGDNLRKVAQSLLGHERSWMEVWATNENVESKWALPAGTRLRYWTDGASAPPTLAMNEPVNNEPAAMDPPPAPMPEPSAEPSEIPSGDMAMNQGDELPAEDIAMNESDKMAELDDPNAFEELPAEENLNPPPTIGATGTPPPPKPVAPPPPPPPAPKADFNKPFAPKKRGNVSNVGNDDPLAALSDDSTIMAGIGALLILAAVIVLIFIRRNRAKRVNFSQTQV